MVVVIEITREPVVVFRAVHVTDAGVTDAFPAGLTCNWSCVATGAGSCTAGPQSGDIADLVDLPFGETVTYTAACAIDPGATGSISNTAVVAPPAGIADPNATNDTAADDDEIIRPPEIFSDGFETGNLDAW